jgi:hypothetical protein
MKKVFLYAILIAFCLNLLIKLYYYFQFEKAEGIVTHHELRSTGRTYVGRTVRYSESVAPSIEVFFNNKKYNLCKMEWGFFYKIPQHSKIEVLKHKEKEEFEINSLFHYWITINDLKYLFGFAVLSTLVYIIYTEKKQKNSSE